MNNRRHRQPSRWLRVLLVALIGMLAGFLRYNAALRLPVDKDEGAYLPAAFRYQEMMSQGRWKDIPSFRGNMEHPPLNKLLYAADLWVRNPQEPQWSSLRANKPIPPSNRSVFYGSRLISAVGGSLEVFIVALVHPLAGVILAFDSYHTKYTSEAYLEGVPGFMAVLSVFLFEIGVSRKSWSRADSARFALTPLILSAIALGLAAAGKYLYGIVGVVTVAFVLYRTRSLRSVILYCSVALLVFVLADPFIWPNPYSRLLESLNIHWRIAHGPRIASFAAPWYSPIIQMLLPEPVKWHPGVSWTRLVDVLILPMSVVGLRRALDERPIWVAWAAFGLLVLLIWPAKMQHYLLLILPPLAVCAGIGIEQLGRIVWSKSRIISHGENLA